MASKEELTRAAFEKAFVELYGPPTFRLTSGNETAVADYSNAFLWFDKHPVHTHLEPSYYYGDIQDKYLLFKAGYNAGWREVTGR